MDKRLEKILPTVQKPSRYVGGEINCIIKEKSSVDTRVAFCFPDTYEIGMSNLGLKILYKTINSLPNVWCERVFAPWGDMEEAMRENGIPLYALESGDPVSDFDFIAFSIGYEMAFTTVLNMLDLAGIPIRATDRSDSLQIIAAGGSACFNPEPMAPFIDLFLIGEGEELDNEVITILQTAKRNGWSKKQFLLKCAEIEGVYVPSFYETTYNADGSIASFKPTEAVPAVIHKRIISDFNSVPFPDDAIVPTTEIVHDRVTLELFRGCIRGCRFCQAGFIYRPVRNKTVETLTKQGINAVKNSGYEEISLSSLSSSDYRGILGLCDSLLKWCEPNNVSLSLPSLRVDNFSMELMHKLQKVRKSGLTFAPEAGSQRLRDVINKNVTEEELLQTCRIAFEGGWSSVKLYFMLGLPSETDEDIVAIAQLAHKVLQEWREHSPNKSRGCKITISTSCFIPKPHTPFQWEAQININEYKRRVELLKNSIHSGSISYKWHHADTSVIEAILSRGDRRIADVLERVFQNGGKLDSWDDYFSYDRYMQALRDCGIDYARYLGQRREDEILPWDHISDYVEKAYLLKELNASRRGSVTPDCHARCSGCGANCLSGGKCDV